MNWLVLCAGSRCSDGLLLEESKNADGIICADGALDWVSERGIRIDLFVGDMDSVSSKRLVDSLGCEVVRLPVEKDMTDGEYAVNVAVEKGASHVVILGGMGNRLDHTLGNIQVLAGLCGRGIEGCLKDDTTTVRVTNSTLSIKGDIGGLLSIIPLGENVVVGRTQGLYYPLEHSHLRLDQVRGVSNVFTQNEAVIELDSGFAAVITTK